MFVQNEECYTTGPVLSEKEQVVWRDHSFVALKNQMRSVQVRLQEELGH